MVRVDDAYNDPRFNRNVDKSSGYKTRTLPLRSAQRRPRQDRRRFEVINKREGAFTADDEERSSSSACRRRSRCRTPASGKF